MTRMTCEQLDEVSAELALGVLSGSERALALEHLQGCASCRAEVEQLASIGDALLELVPPAEPPLGFENRVAALLHERAETPVPRRWARGMVAVVAAACLAVGGWTLGAFTHGPATPATLASSQLVQGTTQVGQLFVYRGHPAWIYMAVDTGSGSGWVTCVLTTKAGTTLRLGTFRLVNGDGYWGAPIATDPSQIDGARLEWANGGTAATAVVHA
ncbi:MAG TPA: hypothetical protein VFA11_11880 [Acidimicrobiales bacterium]|nr:hypothetical protein [Acidimicrobiales bacterium]